MLTSKYLVSYQNSKAVPIGTAFLFVNLIEIVVEYLIAGMAGRIRPWLARVGKQFNRSCGGLFVLIGAALPLRS